MALFESQMPCHLTICCSPLLTKQTIWGLCPGSPAKTQIRLDIYPVRSEPLQLGQWVAKDLSFLDVDADSEDWADAQADVSLHWTEPPKLLNLSQKKRYGAYLIFDDN